jgi:hypothetical protein
MGGVVEPVLGEAGVAVDADAGGFAAGEGESPGPLVTRCRSLTVAKVDSTGFVVRMGIQCSAG